MTSPMMSNTIINSSSRCPWITLCYLLVYKLCWFDCVALCWKEACFYDHAKLKMQKKFVRLIFFFFFFFFALLENKSMHIPAVDDWSIWDTERHSTHTSGEISNTDSHFHVITAKTKIPLFVISKYTTTMWRLVS